MKELHPSEIEKNIAETDHFREEIDMLSKKYLMEWLLAAIAIIGLVIWRVDTNKLNELQISASHAQAKATIEAAKINACVQNPKLKWCQ